MRPHAILAVVFVAVLARGQTPALQLDVTGGSIPGAISADAWPGTSTMPGLLTIGFDNSASTSLGVISLPFVVSQTAFGVFSGGGHLGFAFQVPPQLSLVDAGVYMACLTLDSSAAIIGSPARGVHLGGAQTFRDRGVLLAADRSFASMLPRADGRWMIAGGSGGALFAQVARNDTEIYDDVTDTFVPGPMMTAFRAMHTCTRLADGRWLLVGGVDLGNNPQVDGEIYDPATDTFTATARMTTPRLGHSATLLPNGTVLVTGGFTVVSLRPTVATTLESVTETTEIFDPTSNTWSPGPPLRTPRAAHLTMTLPNGSLLLAGGFSVHVATALSLGRPPIVTTTGRVAYMSPSSDLYDPATNSMVAGPSMARARALVDPIDLGGGRWLCTGGLDETGRGAASAEVFDAVANTFAPAASPTQPRSNHAWTALGGGRFLVVGGARETLLAPVPLRSGEIYDANTDTWTPGPSLNIERTGMTYMITPRGQLQIAGGSTVLGNLTRTCEWFYF